MSTEPERPVWHYRQSGVIPYRRSGARLEVLLITSHKGKRWVIPKGIVDPGLSAAESAAKEALEEAGIEGELSPAPVGRYRYRKWGGECTVEIYLLEVRNLLDQWPEADLRQRRWFDAQQVAAFVREPGLQQQLDRLPALLKRS